MIKKEYKNKEGFSLIELTVSVGIFSIIVVSVMQIFNTSLVAQRKSLALKQIQENIRYSFEVMSKEIRMARVDYNGVCVPANTVYWSNPSEPELYFLNQYQQCVRYFIENSRLKIERGGTPAVFVTPESLKVEEMEFDITGSVPLEQPLITIMTKISSNNLENVDMAIQTTLSTRHYE